MLTQETRLKTLRIFLIVLWACFAAAVVAEAEIVYRILSPVTALFSCIVIKKFSKDIGRYKAVAHMFFIGIAIWFIADVFLFANTFYIKSDSLAAAVSNMYLIPDFCYALGVLYYIKREYKKIHFQRVFVNTFLISVIGFIYASRILVIRPDVGDGIIDFQKVITLLYFFVVLFTLTLMFIVAGLTTMKGHTWGGYVLAITIAIYNVFEMRYAYMLAIDMDSESPYVDIAYVLAMAVFAISFTDTKIRSRKRDESPYRFGEKIKDYVMWVNSAITMIVSIVLANMGYLNFTDIYFVVTAIMAYLIMCTTMKNYELTAELLAQQRNENERLETLVAEKTKELLDMNDYLEKVSNTDPLTGLYNRRCGQKRVADLIEDKTVKKFALLSIDLNYFKPINDNYGHGAGDEVLKELTRRMKELNLSDYIPFRMGGDEFMVLCTDARMESRVSKIADALCKEFDKPIECKISADREDTHTFSLSASMGICFYPEDGESVDELMNNSDYAMYHIKHTHEKSAYVFYRDIESPENAKANSDRTEK